MRLHRARVRGLVLADTRAGADGAAGRRARAAAAARARTAGSVQGEVAGMLPRLLSERSLTGRPEVVTALRTMMEATPVDTFAGAQAGMAERPDSTALLPEIGMPTIVVVGAEDRLTPPAEAEAVGAAIPGASLHVIGGAAHVTPLEAADAFNAVLAAFLLRLKPRRPPGR